MKAVAVAANTGQVEDRVTAPAAEVIRVEGIVKALPMAQAAFTTGIVDPECKARSGVEDHKKEIAAGLLDEEEATVARAATAEVVAAAMEAVRVVASVGTAEATAADWRLEPSWATTRVIRTTAATTITGAGTPASADTPPSTAEIADA